MSENTNETTQDFSFVETEHKILAFWDKERIFQKSLDQTKPLKPYIFYDGPPFATGLPHHGHLVGSTLKDIVPRFFTMKGHYVDRRFGWDCHGLPIEHEIDKKLQMSATDAVIKLGVAGYNNECRQIVQKYTSEWRKTIRRIGRWVDFDNDYKTMDPNFMESVWWVFKELWEKDLVYQSTKVMPFSTALGTVLSNFEAGLNYQMVQDPAVTVLFKLEKEDVYLAAWTTTPWTLPSNLGLCVNKELIYSKVKETDTGRVVIMAQDRVESYQKKHKLEILESFPGSKLVGKKYIPLFNYFADLKNDGAFVVHEDDYVTATDGAGIVHLAPAFGEDDDRVIKKAGLKLSVCPLDANGKFTKDVPDYKGMYIKDADKEIIKKLKNDNLLFDQSTIDHSYPFCYRSQTPLIYRAVPSWYINVEKIKPDLLSANAEINWVPDHLKEGRFGKWLEGARDWAVSRNRVWGTPLPIWINEESGEKICVGSREELHKLSGVMIDDFHREFVDGITFKKAGSPGVFKRIPEVLDCWFESGAMPYAQLHYPFENKDVFNKGFPAEYIAEGLDQTRGWFYTLTVLAAALFKKPAFKNVIVNGLVLAADGKKMSKSLRNYTAPDTLMESYGADALRLFLINSGLVRGEDLRFSDDGVKDMVRRVLLPWYNSFKFFKTYTDVDGWKPSKNVKPEHVLDQWILSKLQTLIKTVDSEMMQYRLFNVVPALFSFIDDLTNWYIRLNRKRFWADDADASATKSKEEAYYTLYTTLFELSKLMAPFAPFLSEFTYLELNKLGNNKEESVHLCKFPQAHDEAISTELEMAVKHMQEVILLGRQKRNQEKVKVKTPLAKLVIIHRDQNVLKSMKKLEETLKVELNVKEIDYDPKESSFIKFHAKPNSPVLGKKLGKDFNTIKNKIAALTTEDILKFEKNGKLTIDGYDLDISDIFIHRDPLPGTNSLANAFIAIDLSCALDEKLIHEGISREIVNRVQKIRKEIGLNVADRVSLKFQCEPELQKIITQYWNQIASETLATTHKFADVILPHQTEIDEYKLGLDVTKVN
jgi:isoleucyl-tRNA synthetase